MPDKVGPHLLGRIQNEPDSRDFNLGDLEQLEGRNLLEGDNSNPLDALLSKLNTAKGVAQGTKDAFASLVEYLKGAPAPTPAPTPPPAPAPSGDVTYTDAEQLDQGNTGHCVGFGWAQWGNTLPIDDHYTDEDGHAIYYECKVIDGEPKQENGSQVRSGAKAMKARKKNIAYAFVNSVEQIQVWLQSGKGPVVVGTDWLNDMFSPDSDGYVNPSGAVAGGHCYLLVGDLVSEGAFLFQNSWGKSWGKNGYFKMRYADFNELLQAQGDACVAIEV